MWVDLCDSCTQMSDRCKWTHRSGLSLCWWLAGCFWKIFSRIYGSIQFSSIAQSCLTLYYPMDCSTPGLTVQTNSWSLLKLMSIESVMPPSHLILCHPLLLPHSIFPSIRVFSNESVLPIRWPQYWSCSCSISPSNEYSGLISSRMGQRRIPKKMVGGEKSHLE